MDLPTKPPGCEITDAADATGLTLSWPAYKAGAQGARSWVPVFWVVGWLVFAVVAAAASLQGRGNVFPHLLLAGWTVAAAVALAVWRRMPTGPTPEFVRLDADALRYDPGHGPSEYRSCADLPSGKVTPVTPAAGFAVSKVAIRGFKVDRVGERQRLLVELDGRQIEIGGCLTESERAWLFAVLQAWRGEAAPAKPWAARA